MPNNFTPFVQGFKALLEQGRQLPLGGFDPIPNPPCAPGAPRALFFAPHPDDEAIGGGLPLRLLRQLGHRIIVVAVTQGSDPERKAPRAEELRGACGFLGFEVATVGEDGLSLVTPQAREADPAAWAGKVDLICALLLEHRPKTVFIPHAGDGHPTHQGTHWLVLDALQRLGDALPCLVVETEFWAALPDPDLLVETTAEEVADLMAALSFHRGEVLRNPYHVLLPSWMSDNVRRGGELIGGQGGAAPECAFANLFRLRSWTGHSLTRPLRTGVYLPAGASLADLFGA